MAMNVDLVKSHAPEDGHSTTGISFAHCSIDDTFYAGLSYGHLIVRSAIVSLYLGLMLVDKTNRILEQFGFRCFLVMVSMF